MADEIGRCETCKHFTPPAEGRRLGECGYGIDESEVADNEVLVENDEGWGAAMGPKFGCVLHEPTP